MARSYPPEFRRKVLDLVESGRPIKQVAEMLGISDQTVYNWRRQHLIDTGQVPGIPSSETAELIAARRRTAELENELAVHRRAAELLDAVVPQKAVRGHRGDGQRRSAGAARGPRTGCFGVRVLAGRV
jgi:transposase-like protein